MSTTASRTALVATVPAFALGFVVAVVVSTAASPAITRGTVRSRASTVRFGGAVAGPVSVSRAVDQWLGTSAPSGTPSPASRFGAGPRDDHGAHISGATIIATVDVSGPSRDAHG